MIDLDVATDPIDLAYQLGALHEQERIASRIAEYDWLPEPRRDNIAERIAEMQAYALASDTTWHGCYPGGAVVFETGALA